MSICDGKLSKNFVRDCAYRPKSGLDNVVYLVNTPDIDKGATQLDTNKALVSLMVLKADKKIYKAEGAGKYPQGSVEIVKGDNGNGWKHKLTLRILYYGVEERAQVQDLVNDGRITAIIKKRDTGMQGELTYEVLGYETGMAIQAVNWSSAENNGTVTLELATEDEEEESTDRKVLMHTDLETTETFLTTNLAIS